MAVNFILILVSIFLVLSTVASLIRWEDWWIRVFDFPRPQLTTLIIITFALTYFFCESKLLQGILLILLSASFIIQGIKIFPYTILAKQEVRKYKGDSNNSAISILISNVLMHNTKSKNLIKSVNKYQPDIILTLETNKWWEKELSILENEYPYTVKIPLENLYGMHLYSKLKLEDTNVNFLVDDDVPSIETYVHLNSGAKIKIYCMHPKPPSPTESESSASRDAEILYIGRKIKETQEPALVFGDLNDVAWSDTTKLFRHISGTLDPRIGRGFYNTFNANIPILRWALDHIFHTNDFFLNKIRRLPHIGSDHFPMYVSLQYNLDAKFVQEIPMPDQEDQMISTEKIQNAGL